MSASVNDFLYAAVMVASLALVIGRVQLLNRMIARQAAPAPSAGESPDGGGTAGE